MPVMYLILSYGNLGISVSIKHNKVTEHFAVFSLLLKIHQTYTYMAKRFLEVMLEI